MGNDSSSYDSSTQSTQSRPVEQKVLESNPLLEAFGNAKTVRNDNSSRFGKFIEIQFDDKHKISGAIIRTYLLERSRIVSVDSPERNFHVFYQLCDGASEEDKKSLRLKPSCEFAYLAQSTCHTLAGVDNKEEYVSTRRAMEIVGIGESDQRAVFRVVAGILHLGNVTFVNKDDEACDDGCVLSGEASRNALKDAAHVLKVDCDTLEKALTTRTIETVEGSITKPLDVKAATNSRDSLAKTLYTRLFDWLVLKINNSIGQDSNSKHFIGVLDIYGFESFKSNSFEQFCINLANEKLQQHFNQHVFKTEQEEYEREEIDWSYIEFVDNQDVLDLIEKKPAGIISLLDEACMFPSTTHAQFATKLYGALRDHGRFGKPKTSQTAFTLAHYAGDVTYETDFFLEKNKDFVVAEHVSLLGQSGCAMLGVIFAQPTEGVVNESSSASRVSKSAMKFSSIGAAFKTQLNDLMRKLETTEPHYVRCVKPNGRNVPSDFENANVLHQLRCGGVLEAVRISCAGYPSRKPVDEFLDRFGLLAVDKTKLFKPGEEFNVARAILTETGLEKTWQIGKTKVFLRAGQMASLDMIRHKRVTAAAVAIQRMAKGRYQQKQFAKVKAAANCVARWSRGMFARRLATAMRLERAVVKTQARARTAFAVRRFDKCKKACTKIQASFRGALARARVSLMRRERAAVTIQAHARCRAARVEFISTRTAAVTFQCAFRSKLARGVMKALKAERNERGALLAAKSELEKKLEMERVRAELERRRQAEETLRREKEATEAAAKLAAMQEEMRLAKEAAEEAALRRAEEAAAAEQTRRDEELAKSAAREAKAEAAATLAKVAAMEAAACLAETKSQAQAAAHATELDAEKAVVKKLETRNLELEKALSETDYKLEAAAEKVLMLENENQRLKQMAKENVMAVAAVRAGEGAGRSPPRHDNETTNGYSAGGQSPLTPDSLGGSPGDMELRRRVEAGHLAKLAATQKTHAEHDTLLRLVDTACEVGFSHGQPILACVTFRSLLHWKSFELERTPLFDRVMQTMSANVEAHTDNNNQLTYWLANTFALLHLLQRTLKTSGGGASSRRRTGLGSGVGIFERFNSRLRAVSTPSLDKADDEATGAVAGIPGVKQVDAKYPAFLFKQQLTAFVEKIYGFLRDNMKKEITPQLGSCIQAPRATRGGAAARRGGTQTATSTATDGGPQLGTHWRTILDHLDALLLTFRANHVPVFLVRKFFTQIFCFINVQLFNALLLRRECCSFSNGEYIKTGLAELEVWLIESKEWTGRAWDELRYIRQATQLLVIHQKPKKTLNEITLELCPVLSIQQLYRISTMYWDDKYGTETVSQDVLHAMKELMMKDQNTNMSNSFLLDDDSSIHFTIDDISGAPTAIDLDAVTIPEHLKTDPAFAFLLSSVRVSEAA